MIRIAADKISPRLQYVCNFIFRDYYSMAFELVQNDGTACDIYYGSNRQAQPLICIQPQGLLTSKIIAPQKIECFDWNGNVAFFKTNGTIPFDIFSAIFYLVSRYEEYLSHEADKHGRYPHELSTAYQHQFLHLPLVNIWLKQFANLLCGHGFSPKLPNFSFTATYDIDMAYAHNHKGLVRNIGGLVKDFSTNRLQSLLSKQKDPNDAFAEMDAINAKLQNKAIYFFLLAEKANGYNKNNPVHSAAMQSLLRHHLDLYEVGIHPSYQNQLSKAQVEQEKSVLEKISQQPVTKSRQHFLKFALPDTFNVLMKAGIKEEYSMGYANANGFRASVAHWFYWYDLEMEKETQLKVFPFCFMDATSFHQLKQSPSMAYSTLLQLLGQCQNNNGQMMTLFHNDYLGTAGEYDGWRQMYGRFIDLVATCTNA